MSPQQQVARRAAAGARATLVALNKAKPAGPRRRGRQRTANLAADPITRRLIDAIDASDMTVGQVAKRAGVGERKLSRWRDGTGLPTIPDAVAVATVLGMSVTLE